MNYLSDWEFEPGSSRAFSHDAALKFVAFATRVVKSATTAKAIQPMGYYMPGSWM